MTSVLVTGANGYIGNATAILLRQRGHRVYGLVRKEADAKALIEQEIIPVVGDFNDIKSIDETLQKVAVVVDMVQNFADNPPLESNRRLLARVTELSKASLQKKRYVYCSGTLVYGDTQGRVVDENTPLKGTMPRVAFEKEILANTDVEVTVVRPTWVYGGAGNPHLAAFGFYSGNEKDEIVVKGNPHKYWPWVHISDLAVAFALVIEAPGAVIAGEIFDVADATRVTVEQARVAFARAAGVKGPVVYGPVDAQPFWQLCEASTLVASNKLRHRLGWQPTRQSVLDDVDLHLKAAIASGVVKARQ